MVFPLNFNRFCHPMTLPKIPLSSNYPLTPPIHHTPFTTPSALYRISLFHPTSLTQKESQESLLPCLKLCLRAVKSLILTASDLCFTLFRTRVRNLVLFEPFQIGCRARSFISLLPSQVSYASVTLPTDGPLHGTFPLLNGYCLKFCSTLIGNHFLVC